MALSIFKVDEVALDRARKLLGLKLPVRIVIRNMRYGGGRYVDRRDGEHIISINCRLGNLEEANHVAWHELTHARQVEQCGHPMLFDALWGRQMEKVGLHFVGNKGQVLDDADANAYNSTRYESEANAVAYENKGGPIKIMIAR